MKNKKQKIVALALVICFTISAVSNANSVCGNTEPIAILIFKINGGGVRADYSLYIAQYLRAIGIELEVKVDDWPLFPFVIETRDFDLTIAYLSNLQGDPDPIRSNFVDSSLVYWETLDLPSSGFGYNAFQDSPYYNEHKDLIHRGVFEEDISARKAIYNEWQQLVMNKIVPILPLFVNHVYRATWSNLIGFQSSWGLVDSLPYIYYNGLHEGQESQDELRFASSNWREMNPFEICREPDKEFLDFITEPIISLDNKYLPTRNGIVEDWERLEDDHYVFNLRKNIYWNPSYNTTERDSSSDLLDPTSTPLMIGLKDEMSNGTNQRVTAKDVVFSLLLYSTECINERADEFLWMKDIKVDNKDPLSFHLYFYDYDPRTEEVEIFIPFWQTLNKPLLPEFYFNSSSLEISNTITGIEYIGINQSIAETNSWESYFYSPFGSGKYMLDYYIRNSVTVLRSSPYWFGTGVIDGKNHTMNIDSVVIRVIPDISAELAEFKAGKLDFIRMNYFPDERIEMDSDIRYIIYEDCGEKAIFLLYNTERPFIGAEDNEIWIQKDGKNFTKAVAVRKAMNYAIDRSEMNEVIHDNDYIIFDSPLPNYLEEWYYDDVLKYDYNVKKAAEWLEAAGYVTPYETSYPFVLIAINVFLLASALLVFQKRMRKRKR
ncbi:MAG: hypothetical protein KAQ70_01015 [Candidatus Heimdallarchaeota archaeon]|nr:hypothetical protein [Candidatus Heimdallarchaeota archaeon]